MAIGRDGWQVVGELALEPHGFLLGLRLKQRLRFLDKSRQIDSALGNREPARIDLRDVEQVLHQQTHLRAGERDALDAFGLHGLIGLELQHRGGRGYRLQRIPQIVRHHRDRVVARAKGGPGFGIESRVVNQQRCAARERHGNLQILVTE